MKENQLILFLFYKKKFVSHQKPKKKKKSICMEIKTIIISIVESSFCINAPLE